MIIWEVRVEGNYLQAPRFFAIDGSYCGSYIERIMYWAELRFEKFPPPEYMDTLSKH